MQQIKETLLNIKQVKSFSNSQKLQNDKLRNDIRSIKTDIKQQKGNFFSNFQKTHPYDSLSDIKASNSVLEGKLVQIKLEFAKKSEEVEEIRDTISKIKNSIKFKDFEIMKLNKELENINENSGEKRESLKPPRQSLGSPRSPIVLLRKKN